MSDSSKYHSFTASDIERYYKGQMSASERHALEKAALDDPFLADSLEGYEFTATPVEDVKALRDRLQKKLKNNRTVLIINRKRWLQIAALFLLLAGSGWLVYRFVAATPKTIALTQSSKIPATPKTPDSVQKDSPKLYAPEVVNPEQNLYKSQKDISIQKEVAKHEAEQNSARKMEAGDTQAADELTAASAPPLIKDNGFQNPQRGRRSFQQVPADSNLESFSNFKTSKNNEVSSTNKLLVPLPDSGKTVTAKAAGIPVSSPDTIHMNVTLQESKEGVNEVVVAGYAKKKSAAKQNIKFGELEPARGWTNFDDYIAQNLKEPEEIKEKALTGDVELSFDVSNEGEAVNIKVEKSLCGQCDQEAIRLLKAGPKWKKDKNKKGRITIHF